MDSPSIPRITDSTRSPGDIDPRYVHVGDVIEAFGEEGLVREIDTDATGITPPHRWTFDAVTATGAELAVARHVGETVHVVARHGEAA